MVDKRMTEEDVVAELRDGMTIGIGGWGSRRKPMSIVRAIANSDLKDLTIASYAGPDLGLLCATGKVKKAIYPFCSLDSIALEPHFRNARQSGSVQTLELDEGMFLLGLQAAAWRVPFLPTRVGLGSFVVDRQPEIKTVVVALRRRRRARRRAGAEPRRRDHPHAPRRRTRQRAVPQRRPLHGQPRGPGRADVLHERRAGACRREELASNGPVQTQLISRLMTHGVVEAPKGAHFTECVPDYGRDEAFQKEYAASAKGPDEWAAWKAKYLDCGDHAEYRKVVGTVSDVPTSTACRLLHDRGRRVLPRRRRDHGQPDRHHPRHRRPPGARRVRARPGDDRRRGVAREQRHPASASTRPTRRSRRGTRTARCSTSCGRAAAT